MAVENASHLLLIIVSYLRKCGFTRTIGTLVDESEGKINNEMGEVDLESLYTFYLSMQANGTSKKKKRKTENADKFSERVINSTGELNEENNQGFQSLVTSEVIGDGLQEPGRNIQGQTLQHGTEEMVHQKKKRKKKDHATGNESTPVLQEYEKAAAKVESVACNRKQKQSKKEKIKVNASAAHIKELERTAVTEERQKGKKKQDKERPGGALDGEKMTTESLEQKSKKEFTSSGGVSERKLGTKNVDESYAEESSANKEKKAKEKRKKSTEDLIPPIETRLQHEEDDSKLMGRHENIGRDGKNTRGKKHRKGSFLKADDGGSVLVDSKEITTESIQENGEVDASAKCKGVPGMSDFVEDYDLSAKKEKKRKKKKKNTESGKEKDATDEDMNVEANVIPAEYNGSNHLRETEDYDLSAKKEKKKKKKKNTESGEERDATDEDMNVEANVISAENNGSNHLRETELSVKGADEGKSEIVHSVVGKPKEDSVKANKQDGAGHDGNMPTGALAFKRVDIKKVAFSDPRLKDNSYWAKDGAEEGYGAKAQEVLGIVRGRNFRHEKTKKKRGTYRGGSIDLQSYSVKFENSDE